MAEFREGWYEISFDARTRDRRCRYFKSTTLCIADCLVKETGLQILLWADPNGKPAAWSPKYPPLAETAPGDWWDREPGGAHYKPELPGSHRRASRALTPRELCQRAGTADAQKADGLSCAKEIHVGLFFDGTNNNMLRDLPELGHSNVVSLYNAHKSDKVENFRYYMPGVGTRFPEIGENTESDDGKRFSSGGEARIHWAMLQIYNALHWAYHRSDLVPEDEMKKLCINAVGGLATFWRVGDDKMIGIFAGLQKRLLAAIKGQRPRVTKLHLSVFGFSRGAAEARTFCQWIQKATQMTVGEAALEIRFLGLFDTVASVGLADSSPVGQGFMDWANGTMDIHGVNQIVHYVAAHEIRQSFPLSTARLGGRGYPANTKEFVYPGAHSDLGGGYSPKSQGKAMAGRAALLSQIPLMDMYFEAMKAGVRLDTKEDMLPVAKVDFNVDPSLDKAFSDYAAWTQVQEKQNVASDGGPPVQNRMQYHMGLYWRWRASVGDDARFKAMSSYRNASRQDQVDLWESEQDWRADVKRAQAAVSRPQVVRGGTTPATPLEKQIVAEVNAAATVPANVSDFYDRYVHDSHGGFWMLGPITKENRTDFIASIKQKKAEYDRLMKKAAEPGINPGFARNMRRAAASYELNSMERRVLETDAQLPGSLPVMTDTDAQDLRDNAGMMAKAALSIMGTATRREPHGHGRYRRVFDRS